MAAYSGTTKRLKNALKTLMATATYDAGNGESAAFVRVITSTEGEFDSYPVLRILPGSLQNDKAATYENERTAAYTFRVLLPLESRVDASEQTFDKMYDLTDLILDTLDDADVHRRLS